MRLVGDDEVEETDIEGLEDLHHGRVGGEIKPLVAILRGTRAHCDQRLVDEIVVGVPGLFAQFAAVAQEQHALDPAGTDQLVRQRNGDAGLASAGGLHDEGLAMLVGKTLRDALDGLQLVESSGDFGSGADGIERLAALPLEHEILQAVLGIKAEQLARRVVGRIVPDPDVETVGIEDHRPLTVHLFQTVGIDAGLGAALLGVDGGFLGLDHRKRLAVVVPQYIVGVALAGGGRLVVDFLFLGYLLGVGAIGADLPAAGNQLAIDQALACGGLVEVQHIGSLLAGLRSGSHVRQLLLGGCGLLAYSLQFGQQRLQLRFLRRQFFQGGLLFLLEPGFGFAGCAAGGRLLVGWAV